MSVAKLSTGALLHGLEVHPEHFGAAGREVPDVHRVVSAFVPLAARLLDCRAGEVVPPFGERDALLALDELQRRCQDAAKAFPASVRTPLVAGLDGLRAAARAAVVASKRGP